MKFLEFKIAGRYLARLPKALLIAIALVFVAAQTLILLGASLPLDPSQRADRVVGVKQYSFSSGAVGLASIDYLERSKEVLGLDSTDYTESFYGETYLAGSVLHTNFADDKVEWEKTVMRFGSKIESADGLLYSAEAKESKFITTSFLGSAEKGNLHVLEVPNEFSRLVLKPGTLLKQSWSKIGVLPSVTVNLNFDSDQEEQNIVAKLSALFVDGKSAFSQAQEPFGCMSENCLMSRQFIIAQGRGDYLSNLATPYLLVILLALLPLLVAGGRELRIEANKLSELSIRNFASSKWGTFRLLAAAVMILNLLSLIGLLVGWGVYWKIKSETPEDFGSVLVPFDLVIVGLIWSGVAAAFIAFTGGIRTHTFVAKSLSKSQKIKIWFFALVASLSGFVVLTQTLNPATFQWFSSPEVRWEAIVALGLLIISLWSLGLTLAKAGKNRSLFKTSIDRKYPLMPFVMVASLFSASLLSGVALPATALTDRVTSVNDPLLYPHGMFSVPRDGGYVEAVSPKATLIGNFFKPKYAGVIHSSVPFASGGGNFLVFSRETALKLWPELRSEPKLEAQQLFLFENSVDKLRTKAEVVKYQLEDKSASYLSHFLKTNDAWGSSYSGVFIDSVPKAFSEIFDGEEHDALLKTANDPSAINALVLNAGLDPAPVRLWYDHFDSPLVYRVGLFLVFSFLLGLILSFLVVRAINTTFKREASLIKALGYSSREIQKTLRAMLLKNFGIAMALGMVGLAFYFVRSNESVDALPEEVLMGVGAFLFASFTGLIPILFAGRIRLQVEEDVR